MTRFNDRRFVLAVSTGVLPSLALAQDLSHGESPDDSLQKLAVAHSHFSGMAAGTALFVVAIVAMALLFSFFREKRRQDLIARFVDKGVEIPPGLLPAGPSRQRELRRGTVLVALGLGLGVALYALGGLWMALWSVILLFLGAASFVNAMLFYPGDDRRP